MARVEGTLTINKLSRFLEDRRGCEKRRFWGSGTERQQAVRNNQNRRYKIGTIFCSDWRGEESGELAL